MLQHLLNLQYLKRNNNHSFLEVQIKLGFQITTRHHIIPKFQTQNLGQSQIIFQECFPVLNVYYLEILLDSLPLSFTDTINTSKQSLEHQSLLDIIIKL
jgi:hypothetical protein